MTQNERLATMHPVTRLTSRIPKRIAAVGIVATLGFLALAAYAMFVSLPGHIKVAPVAIVVHSASSLPAEVQALETQTAALLFDRDTTTAHVAYADQSIDAQLEKQTEIKSINIYGPAPYELTVQAQQGSTWSTIAGLDKIKLTSQPAAWNSFPATQAVTTGALRFVLSIPSGNSGGGSKGTTTSTAGGIPEIEIWATGEHALVNGTTLVAAMPAGTTTQAKPAQARAYTATPASAVIGNDGQTFRFTLDRPTNRFKRAWLSYEAYGLSHWVSPVRRINGLSIQGGSFTFSGTDWTPLTEPIHPDWLVTGSNRVDFTLPANMAGSYSVRNVRVITELDDGNNFIVRATTITGATTKQAGTEIDAPVLNDGDLTTGWSPYVDPRNKTGQPALTLTFDKPTQIDTLSLNLVNALSGTMSVDLLVGGQWQSAGLPTINGKKLTAGWNNLNGFAQVSADALRISFLNGSDSPGEIREIAASGSGTGTAYVPNINVAYPDAGQFYGREAYIRGYLSVPDNGSGPAAVAIAGKSIATPDGSFGLVVSKEDAGYASQADAEPWQVEVAAIYPDGQKLTQIVKLTQAFDAAKAHGLLPNAVNPLLLVLGDASLDIDSDAMDKQLNIKITALMEKDLPPLDPGMTNVTPSPQRGYRFTPSPHKFKKDIKVTIPFDPALIPVGLKENDVKTYYFDIERGHWVELARYKIDSGKRKVTSFTNHFTDMINATLTVPDHPETVSFNATQMKDIKAADPGAGINLIEPPKANNMGDARLSYPIEIPQGRQGMQPQLAISYSSGGGNGWLGMGWDLSVPSITIDTRWGVPRYDADKETETYMLNGEMLTPVAHRGALQDRTSSSLDSPNGKIFHTRVEGQFRQIIRHGTVPTNYWWEVTDKNGTKNFYGGMNASDTNGKLGGTQGIFKWMLRKTIDSNGNMIEYEYSQVQDSGVGTGIGGIQGDQRYISAIYYTGLGDSKGEFSILFKRERELGDPRREDVMLDARGGFKQVTADRLKRVEVRNTKQLVRSYVLHYHYGPFTKSLLDVVVQYDAEEQEFNRHEFAYIDEIHTPGSSSFTGFNKKVEWGTGGDNLGINFLGTSAGPSALGGSEGLSAGGSFSLGFAPFPTKYLSGNMMIGNGTDRGNGSLSLTDVDGDGLPDKLYKSGGIKYRKNMVTPDTNLDEAVNFSAENSLVANLSKLSEEETQSFNFGGQAYIFGLNLVQDTGFSFTQQKSYLTDVNGDGIIDVVDGGQVKFGQVQSGTSSIPSVVMLPTSSGTEFPIGSSAATAPGLLPAAEFAAIEQTLLKQNPLADAVRRWTAPFSGKIDITGAVKLAEVFDGVNDPDYQSADGVKVSISKASSGQQLAQVVWSQEILQNDLASYTPTSTQGISVTKGDTVYFRVQSRFDGAYDEVQWAPVIRYRSVAGKTVTDGILEANNLSAYRFEAANEFVYGGRINPISMPFRGKVRLTGALKKTAKTTDDVSVAVYQFSKSELETLFTTRSDFTLLHKKKAPLAVTKIAHDLLDEDIPLSSMGDIPVNEQDVLFIVVQTDSNIDLTKVSWKNPLKLFYVEAYRPSQAPASVSTEPDSLQPGDPLIDESGNPTGYVPGSPIQVQDETGKYLIEILPIHEYNHYPVSDLVAAQESWTSPETGWLMVVPNIHAIPVQLLDALGRPKLDKFHNPVFERKFTRDSEMSITVKTAGERLHKELVDLPKDSEFNPRNHSFAIPATKADLHYYDFSSRDPAIKEQVESTDVKVHFIRSYTSARLENVAVNTTPTMWQAPMGTLTVMPDIKAKPGAPALRGTVVLKVTGEVLDADGIATKVNLAERVINIDTTQTLNPYGYAIDIEPEFERNLSFVYLISDSALAKALNVTAVNVLAGGNHTRAEKEFANLALFNASTGTITETYVAPDDSGKATIAVSSSGIIALAPMVTLSGSRDINLDGTLSVVVDRRYTPLDENGDPVEDKNGNIKFVSEEIARQVVELQAGVRHNPGKHTFDVLVNAAGPTEKDVVLTVRYETASASLKGANLEFALWTQFRQGLSSYMPPSWIPPQALHWYGTWDVFPNNYRGWSYVGYNGDGAFKDQAIDQNRFIMSANAADYSPPTTSRQDATESVQNNSMSDSKVFPAIGQVENQRWVIGDERWWITANSMSASRMGVDNVRMPRDEDIPGGDGQSSATSIGAGASGVPRMSIVPDQQTMGIGFLVSLSTNHSAANGLLDFMDLNGDRFPDIVSRGSVQYSNMVGGMGSKTGSLPGENVRQSKSDAFSIAPGGTVPKSVADAKASMNSRTPPAASPSMNSNFGFVGSLGSRDNISAEDFVDINGDGLPDRVNQSPSGDITVQLNLGYRFEAPELWGKAPIDNSQSQYVNAGGSVSFNDGVKGFAGSLSLTNTLGSTKDRLADINGDGLPDRISEDAQHRLLVGINTGGSFQQQVVWSQLSASPGKNQAFAMNGGVSYNYTVGPLCIALCYIDINPAVSISTNRGRPEAVLQDINGDGFVDFLESTSDDKMYVALNRIGKTNLLRTVTRPLGATITLDYTRLGNKYEMPQSMYALTKVAVFDGVAGDTPETGDYQVIGYQYEHGNQDRFERDFLGFQTVTSTQYDTAGRAGDSLANLPAYRRTVQTYGNRDVYEKGLLQSEVVEDSQGKKYTETRNIYKLWSVNGEASGFVLRSDLDRYTQLSHMTLFPQLVRTEHRFFEGGQGEKSTYTTQEYDATYGNITHFFDAGDAGSSDDVEAIINYSTHCADSYIVGKPLRIDVIGAGQLMRQRIGTLENCTSGNLKQLRQMLDNDSAAVTDLEYYPNGNLKTVTGPGDKDRYVLTYVYDDVVSTYVTSVSDSFSYSSAATYDYNFGKPLTTTDLNGNVISYVYDSFGRTKSVKGPYEQGTNKLTLQFAYPPKDSPAPPVPYATTLHLNLDASGAEQAPIETVLFTDGLKRVLQTKKSVAINGTPMLAVSGRVVFDAFGRTIKQYYPVSESLGQEISFNSAQDDFFTTTSYDVLDRSVLTTLPDGTTTSIEYGFDSDRNDVTQFKTTVTDANGKVKESYRDIGQLITAVKEFNNGKDIWTSYRYDPLKQIIEVRDAKNHLTTATYDNLGRRTVLSNPDTGTTRTVYDLASNVVQKITANLAASGQAVTYDYDFNRLKAIHYPDTRGNDVTYEYGAAGLSNGLNQVGRITKVTDASGHEERAYGKLGETVKEVRTIASHTQGNSANSPEVYTTQYKYDTFGRILTLALPDSEIITYAYDAGGNLAGFAGDKVAQGAGANHTDYLQTLHYDKFEQRTYMKLGNGIETRYTYRPDNRRLSNLNSEGRTAGKFQNLDYKYDSVGNITNLANSVDLPKPGAFGGPTAQTFGYDDLYRLTSAKGNFTSSPSKVRDYTLNMGYDDIHNITVKTQTDTLTSAGGNPIPQKATSYDWAYAYGAQQPHAPSHIGSHSYSYDANGNQTGWTDDKSGARRIILWDEDNRISEILDNGHSSKYTYDNQGQRVIKETKQGETVYVNQYYVVRNRSIVSKHLFAGSSRLVTRLEMGTAQGNSYQGSGSNPSSGSGNTNSASLNAGGGRGESNSQGNANVQDKDKSNQGLHLGQDKQNPGQGTANAGQGDAQRNDNAQAAEHGKGNSKSNAGDKGNANSNNANNAGGNGVSGQKGKGTTNLPGNSEAGLENALANGKGNKYGIYKRLDKLGYTVDDNGDIVIEAGEDSVTPISEAPPPTSSNGQSDFIYYYHPDHLGSTGFVTDGNGNLYEHIEYFPFGETWVQEHSNTLRTPYLFTGKELDQETGLYYFGARYYDPRTSVWQSADPILGKYLPSGDKEKDKNLSGMGGVYNSLNLDLYTYAHQNPVKIIDPDGREAWLVLLPRKGGGFDFVAFDDKGSTVQTGMFNVKTWVNTQTIQAGEYTVSPRPHIETTLVQKIKDVFAGDRNANEGNPTISNTDNWNQIRNSDGSTMEGVQIHPGRTAEGGGVSKGCLVCSDVKFGPLNEMFKKNYSDGGVNLIVRPIENATVKE